MKNLADIVDHVTWISCKTCAISFASPFKWLWVKFLVKIENTVSRYLTREKVLSCMRRKVLEIWNYFHSTICIFSTIMNFSLQSFSLHFNWLNFQNMFLSYSKDASKYQLKYCISLFLDCVSLSVLLFKKQVLIWDDVGEASWARSGGNRTSLLKPFVWNSSVPPLTAKCQLTQRIQSTRNDVLVPNRKLRYAENDNMELGDHNTVDKTKNSDKTMTLGFSVIPETRSQFGGRKTCPQVPLLLSWCVGNRVKGN